MRDKLMYPPKRLLFSLGRLVGAGVLTLCMAVTFSATAFAKEAAFTSDAFPTTTTLQQESSPTDANLGLVILGVDEAGPAAKAGIVRGDILQMAGNVAINSTAMLYGVVRSSKVGDEVVLVVQHGDESRTIPVTLGQRGDQPYLGVEVVDAPAVAAVQSPQISEAAPNAAGQVVTATLVVSDNVVTVTPGLIVVDVMAGSPAATAGLAAGDLILAINSQALASPDDLVNALKGHTPGEVVMLYVQKGGPVGENIIGMPVTLGTAPDDPGRAYLGISIVSMSPGVKVEASPTTSTFTAPAIPAVPALPTPPDVVYSYAAPTSGQACGATIQQYIYPPADGGATFSLPAVPALPPLPATPGVPFFIYQSGVNAEAYPYTVSGQVQGPGDAQGNIIVYRAKPAAGYAAPVTQAYPGTAVDVTTSSAPVQKQIIIMGSQAQPAQTVAVPGMMQGQNVTIVHGQADAPSSYWVKVAPDARRFEVIGVGASPDQTAPAGAYVVKGAATTRKFEVIRVEPAAGTATLQVAPQAVPVPVPADPAGDGWY